VTESFLAPAYIQTLIQTISNRARAAHNSALTMLLLGLYLIATAVSTTDEDLLRETTRSISQLGVQVPVVIAFALAPVIFLSFHIASILRYHALVISIKIFESELQNMVGLESDRYRCRSLLENMEFAPVSKSISSMPIRTISDSRIAGGL
jgi:hypothetical protein